MSLFYHISTLVVMKFDLEVPVAVENGKRGVLEYIYHVRVF